jgi:hypothetical protein
MNNNYQFIKFQKNCEKKKCISIQYNKQNTSFIDPTITQRMRYSQIIKNNGIR